jgi:hypothetical protein
MRNRLDELSEINAVGEFSTGNTVTITVYDLSDSSLVTLDTASCTEIGSTGIFKWPFSNITTAPIILTEYLYIMTDSFNTQSEVEVFGGWTEDVGREVVPIPGNTCKISANIFEPRDEAIGTDSLFVKSNGAFAQILGSYYQSASTKFFTNEPLPPFYTSLGEAYWIFPQGSLVKFFIPQLGISASATIPATSTANLNDLLGL